ncbi:hypothetical protein [Shewanella ulleungensis]|jgi:hypothetical protein|uniref:hypothetical protein n=1 Tax=Shewanella ulleungensis TaxID=2282699 RepID=UPI003D7A8970
MLTRPMLNTISCCALLLTPQLLAQLLLTSLLWITSIATASEFSQLTAKPSNNSTELNNSNANTLPQQSASDSQGNAITLPAEPRSALEYNADDIYIKPSLQKHIEANKPKKLSSRQANTNVADDPSCRWLKSRIKHLQKKQLQTQNSSFSHYQDEIDIRESEWACLKCATSGPNDVDRGECQHKR